MLNSPNWRCAPSLKKCRIGRSGAGDTSVRLSMRAFIRDLKSGLFCGKDLHWKPEQEEACDFGSTFEAATFAAEHLLQGVEVVLTFDRPEQEQRVNLEQESGSLRFYGSRH